VQIQVVSYQNTTYHNLKDFDLSITFNVQKIVKWILDNPHPTDILVLFFTSNEQVNNLYYHSGIQNHLSLQHHLRMYYSSVL
jgi:hypothetical protein